MHFPGKKYFRTAKKTYFMRIRISARPAKAAFQEKNISAQVKKSIFPSDFPNNQRESIAFCLSTSFCFLFHFSCPVPLPPIPCPSSRFFPKNQENFPNHID